METTDDGLLGNRIRILQPKKGYRVAIDSVLLAAAVPAGSGERVLDIGAGAGAAALCLATRCPDVHVTGLEPQSKLSVLAEKNVARNDLGERVEIVQRSLADIAGGPLARGFDHAMANPPYYEAGEGTASPDSSKEAAQRRHGPSIADWARAAAAASKSAGTITFVYPANREKDLTGAFAECGRGEIRILPLIPKEGRAPKRIIVQFRRGQERGVRRLEGLILHQEDGRYTDEVEGVLRHAEALALFRA